MKGARSVVAVAFFGEATGLMTEDVLSGVAEYVDSVVEMVPIGEAAGLMMEDVASVVTEYVEKAVEITAELDDPADAWIV